MRSRRRLPFVTAVALLGLAPALHGQMATTTFNKGEVTFTQGGKETTWVLADQGGLLNYNPSKPKDYSLGLRYRPKDATPTNLAFLDLSLVEEGNSFLFSLHVQGGSGGEVRVLEAPLGPPRMCKVRFAQLGAGGVQGSATCEGAKFEGGGKPVTKLTFAARP